MIIANWKTQVYNVVQSLLFNNPQRVIEYHVRDDDGRWVNRAELPATVRRLYETETTDPQRACLETIQFVHHMLIPPGGRHVAELHIHPEAEEIVVITRGRGRAIVADKTFDIEHEDVVYVPTGTEHEFQNTGDELLGVLFINVPTRDGLTKLQSAQAKAEQSEA